MSRKSECQTINQYIYCISENRELSPPINHIMLPQILSLETTNIVSKICKNSLHLQQLRNGNTAEIESHISNKKSFYFDAFTYNNCVFLRCCPEHLNVSVPYEAGSLLYFRSLFIIVCLFTIKRKSTQLQVLFICLFDKKAEYYFLQ